MSISRNPVLMHRAMWAAPASGTLSLESHTKNPDLKDWVAVMELKVATISTPLHWPHIMVAEFKFFQHLQIHRRSRTDLSFACTFSQASLSDSLQGQFDEIGMTQRRLAWRLRKADTHKSRSVPSCLLAYGSMRQPNPRKQTLNPTHIFAGLTVGFPSGTVR